MHPLLKLSMEESKEKNRIIINNKGNNIRIVFLFSLHAEDEQDEQYEEVSKAMLSILEDIVDKLTNQEIIKNHFKEQRNQSGKQVEKKYYELTADLIQYRKYFQNKENKTVLPFKKITIPLIDNNFMINIYLTPFINYINPYYHHHIIALSSINPNILVQFIDISNLSDESLASIERKKQYIPSYQFDDLPYYYLRKFEEHLAQLDYLGQLISSTWTMRILTLFSSTQYLLKENIAPEIYNNYLTHPKYLLAKKWADSYQLKLYPIEGIVDNKDSLYLRKILRNFDVKLVSDGLKQIITNLQEVKNLIEMNILFPFIRELRALTYYESYESIEKCLAPLLDSMNDLWHKYLYSQIQIGYFIIQLKQIFEEALSYCIQKLPAEKKFFQILMTTKNQIEQIRMNAALEEKRQNLVCPNYVVRFFSLPFSLRNGFKNNFYGDSKILERDIFLHR